MDQHHRLAESLFEFLELPTGVRFEAYTEVWVTPSRRVDMQVIAKDAANADVAQVWSEHKRAGGAFSTDQREDYLAALERQGGGRLVTIVADLRDDDDEEEPDTIEDDIAVRPGEASPDEPRWWALDWQFIAELAYGAGQAHPGEWGGRWWRDNAVKPEAPAAQRALHELLWYLEEEGYAVVEPLTSELVVALKHLPETVSAATTLLERAADNMTSLKPEGEAEDYEDGGFGQSFEVPEASWVHRLDGGAEVVVHSDDGWIDEPQGEPSLAADVSLDADWYRPLSAQTEWVARAHAAGYSFREYGAYVLIYATRPLADVTEKGTTIAEQARFVAGWAEPLIQQILSDKFDPGPVERSPKPRRRSQAPIPDFRSNPGVSEPFPVVPGPTDEWVVAVREREERLVWRRACEMAGVDVRAWRAMDTGDRAELADNYRRAAARRLAGWATDAEIRIRIKPETLAEFLSDGVYKTLFETGTSGGTANVEVRRRVEAVVLNVPAATPANQRPTYGYLSGSTETDDIEQWGDIVLCLRAEVRARSTFVLGDSIDATLQGNRPAFAPVPVNQPDLLGAAVDRNVATAPTMGDACYGGYGYAEVHMHGRVRPSDVARAVLLDATLHARVEPMLADAGIAVEVGRQRL